MPHCGWCVPDPHIVGPFGELRTFVYLPDFSYLPMA